jgi:hypothetical protein
MKERRKAEGMRKERIRLINSVLEKPTRVKNMENRMRTGP